MEAFRISVGLYCPPLLLRLVQLRMTLWNKFLEALVGGRGVKIVTNRLLKFKVYSELIGNYTPNCFKINSVKKNPFNNSAI